MKSVVLYTTDYCPYCRRAEQFLETKGIPFEQIDVSGDDALREKLVAMSGGRRTVPQIFIGGEPIGGYTDLIALDRQGKLTALLDSAA